MPATRAEKTVRHAAAKAPATITKQHRGQPAKRHSFKAWTVSQLLETYRDPRAVLMEIASTETAALAKTLNCTMQDALAERRLAAMCVLPYVAQKLPAQVDMRLTRAINLNIVDDRQYKELVEIAATEQDDADGFSMQLLPATSEEANSERPAAQPQQQERAIQWDISPGNKGAQRKNVTSVEPVTPPTPAPPGEAE